MITKQIEWLAKAKHGLNNGVIKFAIPLFIVYWISDLYLVPDSKFTSLGIRLSVIPISLLLNFLAQKCNDRSRFMVLFTLQIIYFSIAMLSIAILLPYTPSSLFIGLVLIAVGVFNFFAITTAYFLLWATIIFLPFFVLTFTIPNFLLTPTIFISYFFSTICLLTILFYSNKNLGKTLDQEYESRLALHNLITDKEKKIRTIGDQLTQYQFNERLNQIENERKDEVYRLSRQLSHDIRSPLSALNLITDQIKALSPDMGQLLTDISKRINGIADSVLVNFYDELYKKTATYETNVIDSITRVLREKKIRWSKTNKNITVNTDFGNCATDLVRFDQVEFERIFSNLLENCFDAFKKDGVIAVRVFNSNENIVECTIRDNGSGIPAEIIKKIGTYGFTFGKSDGSGIAISHAMRIIEKFQGKFGIESKQNEFTQVNLAFSRILKTAPLRPT